MDSSRREEIERQVAAWKEEWRFAEVPEGRLYEMAALETRDPKRSISREEVAGIFEKGFEACGAEGSGAEGSTIGPCPTSSGIIRG